MADIFLELSQGKHKILQKVEEISQVFDLKSMKAPPATPGERRPKGPKGAFIVSCVEGCSVSVDETYGEVTSMILRAGAIVISLEGERTEVGLTTIETEIPID